MIANLKTRKFRRKGVILLVVLAMLVLLTIIGITFVCYAQSLEAVSEANLDAENGDTTQRFDPGLQASKYWNAETALSQFVGQLGFDVADDATGIYSVIRGHTLARDLYGASSAVDGSGNVAFPLDRPFGAAGYADPTQPNFIGQASISGQPNVPYTAPDTRHWYLAKLGYDPQGKLYVVEPSFWRDIPSCNSPTTMSQTFRYRPNVEMTAGFPVYPTIANKFDVINLPGGTKEDSIWIDINAPVITLPNGKKIKPMVAPLIVDLDGRLHLGMAGNRMTKSGGTTWVHGSHEGYGPWEGNVDKLVALLQAQGDPNMAAVASLQSALLSTKYGSYGFPFGSTQTGGGSGGGGASGYSPRAHNQVDFNGGVDPVSNGLTGPVPSMLPGAGGSAQPFQAFPFFHPGMFGNWAYNETNGDGTNNTPYIHPNAYNPNFPQGSNIAYAIRDMGPLLLWRSDKDNFARDQSNNIPTKQGLASVLGYYGVNGYRPNFFDHVTLLSADFDKPGLYPAVDDKTQRGLQWATAGSLVQPSWARRVSNTFAAPPAAEQNALGLASRELTRYARINLASFGPDYPEIDPTTGLYRAGTAAQVTQADQGRALLARKVLEGLCAATGSFNPFAQDLPTNWYDDTKPEYFFTSSNNYYKASIWLVQLAANIVDFVDPDDVMTQIVVTNALDKGHSSRTIYGTELPKVVINEVYAQVDNANSDYIKPSGVATSDYKVSLFLELLNALNDPTPPLAANVNRPNTAYIQVKDPATSYVHTVYEIELTPVAPVALYDPLQSDVSGVVNSHLGNTFPSPANHVLNSWTDSSGAVGNIALSPSGAKFNTLTPQSGVDGFLWIGPDVTSNIQHPTLQGSWKAPNTAIPLVQPNRLQYTWEKGKAVIEPTVLMRRLANPGIQVGPNNPYVLVDFFSVKKDMIEEGRKRDTSGGLTETPVDQRKSYGRRQPFAGKDFVDFTSSPKDLGAYKVSTKNNGTGAPLHTFGALNFAAQPTTLTNSATAPTETAETPDWLSHFDRVPASPLSLLMVSTYRPHELTQKFLDQIPDPGTPTNKVWVPHQHAAAWMDEMTGLQRFFELVQTHGEHALTQNATGQPISLFPKGGRLMGRVNLNTVPIYWNGTANRYQSPVLEALFDSNGSNRFYSAADDTIRSLINDIGTYRANGGYFYGYNPQNRQGSNLQSKVSPAAPTTASYDPWQYNQIPGTGVYQPYNGNLLFDPFSTNPLSQPNGTPARATSFTTHPLVRLEALEKIYNQTTNRSNVFAIWLTVGFFEVVSIDNSRTPAVVLGAEYGSDNGRNVRIKSFSIVDRTKIYAYETALTAPITPALDPATGDLAWGMVPINATAPFKDKNNAQTNIEPRTQKQYNLLTLAQAQPLVLTIDPDLPTEETVEAFFVSGQLQAQFQKAHQAGARVVSRGNPGPMKNYSVNQDKDFVVYWTILE